MAIAKIRIGNRVTIPPEVMQKQNLHVGDEVYFEVFGVIGRDVFMSGSAISTDVTRNMMPVYHMVSATLDISGTTLNIPGGAP